MTPTEEERAAMYRAGRQVARERFSGDHAGDAEPPEQRMPRAYVVDQLHEHARRLAQSLGRDPLVWPWPRGTTPWLQLLDKAQRFGLAPAREHLDGMFERERGMRRRPGPKAATTKAKVEEVRQRLIAVGLPHGERQIALEIGVSRSAVRYALGKDRKGGSGTKSAMAGHSR